MRTLARAYLFGTRNRKPPPIIRIAGCGGTGERAQRAHAQRIWCSRRDRASRHAGNALGMTSGEVYIF
jgi:hypothetical protein